MKIFTFLTPLFLITVILEWKIAQGLRCAHCAYNKLWVQGQPETHAKDHSRMFPESGNLAMHHSCASGESPDHYITTDCSKVAESVSQEVINSLFTNLRLTQLEMKEYLNPPSFTNSKFSCFTIFMQNLKLNGDDTNLDFTMRSCIEKSVNFTEYLNDLGKSYGESVSMTGYKCDTDECNRFDSKTSSGSSSGQLDLMSNILIAFFFSFALFNCL